MLAGLLYTLAQPGWSCWPLAFVCLAPLVLACGGRGARARALLGWVMGTTGAIGTIGPTVYGSGTLFFGLGPLGACALVAAVAQLFAGIPVALFAWLAGDPLRTHPALAALRVAAAWTAQELLRSVLFGGLPWTFLAHALAPVPALIQAASLGGAFLVSFWLAALNAACGIGLAARPARGAWGTAGAIVVAVCLHALVVGMRPETDGPRLRARLVQPNVPESWRTSPGGIHRALDRLVELTRSGDAVDVALWPENAVNALLPLNDLPLAQAMRALDGSASRVVLGAPRAEPDRPGRFRNSAFLVDAAHGITAFHDKVHLVPFAEYAPWPARALGLPDPSYEGGERPTLLPAGPVRLGPLVCYEVIFPSLSRSLVRDGAGILVNLSNDYWLGGPGGSEQHLAAAVFRAVEFSRPMLRATNTGVTAAIDARGRILERIETGVAAAATVAVRPATELTVYARLGDAFAWLAAVAALATAVREGRLRRPRSVVRPRAARRA